MSYSPTFAQYGRTPCLENSGYVNPVFSASDIFGSPNPFNLAGNSAELPVGADDSAIPQLAQDGLRTSSFATGSNVNNGKGKRDVAALDQKSTLLTVAFIAIVAAALYYQ